MSSIISQRYLMARGASAFLNYLHLDVVITGLVLAFVFLGGLASDIDIFRTARSALPNSTQAGEVPTRPLGAEQFGQNLTPTLRAALAQVVQRYRVSAEALLPVFEAVQTVGRERNLDPLLLIAVIAIESRFNPFSQSPMGAQGLMQIIPRYHYDKVPMTAGEQPFLDPITNVQIGAQILQEAIRRHGGLVAGLQYYGGATDDDEQTYANKVLAEKLRLEQASRRRDGSTA